MLFAHLLAFNKKPSAGLRMLRHDAFEEFGTAGAHQSIKPEDFSGAHGQRHVFDHEAAAQFGQCDVLGAEYFGAKFMAERLREVL